MTRESALRQYRRSVAFIWAYRGLLVGYGVFIFWTIATGHGWWYLMYFGMIALFWVMSMGWVKSTQKTYRMNLETIAIREELKTLQAANPSFSPAFPAAVNPVLRRPVRTGARVWLENEDAAATVDVANTAYMLMLRLLSHSYLVPRPNPLKALCIDLALGLMRAMAPLAEHAARLPAGPSNPNCNAGMSFTALRDAAPLPPGASAAKFFVERLRELSAAAAALATGNGTPLVLQSLRILQDLTAR
jgi:hypothetical protein